MGPKVHKSVNSKCFGDGFDRIGWDSELGLHGQGFKCITEHGRVLYRR